MSHLIEAGSEKAIRAGADSIEKIIDLHALSDDALDQNLKILATAQNQCTAAIVAHLQELEYRDLPQRKAYPSLFAYCVKELRFSEDVACRHILALRAARRFPSILPMLARGEINLTTISILNRHLNAGNHQGLLRWAAGKSRRELERRVAQIAGPAAALTRDVIRHVPAPAPPAAAPPATDPSLDFCEPPSKTGPATASKLDAPPASASAMPGQTAPLPGIDPRPDVRFAFSAPETLLLKIERIKALLRHKFPAGRLEDVVGEIAQFYLTRRDPALKKTARPRPAAAGRKRRLAQRIKDVVFERDGGRCAFISTDGRRCEETGGLEYDHIVAWAHGGASDDPANVRLLCRQHNQFLGRKAFGGPRLGGRAAQNRQPGSDDMQLQEPGALPFRTSRRDQR